MCYCAFIPFVVESPTFIPQCQNWYVIPDTEELFFSGHWTLLGQLSSLSLASFMVLNFLKSSLHFKVWGKTDLCCSVMLFYTHSQWKGLFPLHWTIFVFNLYCPFSLYDTCLIYFCVFGIFLSLQVNYKFLEMKTYAIFFL